MISRVTVTASDVTSHDSITIDSKLVDAAGMKSGLIVSIRNYSGGKERSAYIVRGQSGKGEIIMNGPAANHFKRGDEVAILELAYVNSGDAKDFAPTVVQVDDKNQIISVEKGFM